MKVKPAQRMTQGEVAVALHRKARIEAATLAIATGAWASADARVDAPYLVEQAIELIDAIDEVTDGNDQV